MSKLNYDGSHWSNDMMVFQSRRQAQGPLAVRFGQNCGGTSAFALLGPDIESPGGRTNNAPSATGPGWNQPWGNAPPAGAGPNLSFNQDAANNWVRGHLINAEWDGSGANWDNLTPLTSQGNANHRSVETRLRVYLQNFRAYDGMHHGHQTYWYALQYWVQVSTDPWAAVPAAGDLYSYCPNFIRATWRVVTLPKRVGTPGTMPQAATLAAQGAIDIAAPTAATANKITTDMPNFVGHGLPAALTNTQANQQEAGNGAVYALPIGAPPIPAVGSIYDGTVDIFQD